MVNEIEAEYNKLSKKYKLPKFREIDEEFEISSLESPKFLIRIILRKIAEKLEFYIDVIGNLVQPDASSLSSMYEVRYFSDDEKNDMHNLFKKLMKVDRNILGVMLKNDEKQQAEFLNKFFNNWSDTKKELLKFIEKMEDSWEKQSTIEEDTAYFG
jgi:hypothetical protein|tara:strand:- start:4213 stop:4680 length:468 start_codon:yes stop_codon:yes gene_type:complete